MRRVLHTSWISLLALALLVAGAIYYAGWTESGLQRLVQLASRQLGPVTLDIRGARGTLHGGLHVDYVLVEHRRVRVIATGVDARVALLPLLWQTIRVEDLRIERAQVIVPHYTDTGAPWQPHFLIGLLTIEAGQVSVAHTELTTPAGKQFVAEQLHASGWLGAHEIRIHDSTLLYSGVEVQGQGTLQAANPMQIQGVLRLSARFAGQPDWLANAQLDGNLDRLGINGGVLAPFRADFRGAALALTGDWHWQGNSQVRTLDLRAWGAGGVLGVISGKLDLHGDHNGFSARGTLEPPGLKSGPLAVDFAGSYAERVLSISRVLISHGASGTQLQAAGTVGIISGGPRLDLQGQWGKLRWPLADASAPVHSSAGAFTLAGVWPFALRANGELRVMDLPAMQFIATGRLDHHALEVSSTRLAAFGGEAQLHGEVRWTPAETWSLGGMMNRLDVASLRPAVRGRLNFAVQASGAGFGKGGTLLAKFTELAGQVRGQKASGHATIGLEGDDWLLQQVRLQLGATHIELDGRAGGRLDLQFALDAADLGLLHPGARGSLQAHGHVRGNQDNPVVQGEFTAAGVSWDSTTLHGLQATINFDPQGSGRADASIAIDRLKLGNRAIEHLHFTTAGTALAHQFTLQMNTAPLALQAGGGGSYARGVWRAELAEVNASDGGDNNFVLEAPAGLVLAVSGDDLELRNLCLRAAAARLCASGELLPLHRQFRIDATNVPMRALTAGLRTDTDFDGTLSLAARGEAPASGRWNGSLQSQLATASVRHHLVGGRIETFSLGNGAVQAELDGSNLVASVALDAGEQGSIGGHLEAQRTGDDWQAWPLKGELRLLTQSLGFIDSYVAQVDRVSGRLDANLLLAGNFAAPVFNGELKVSDGQVDAYNVNLALREVSFDARLNDSTLQLEGSANAGADGHARFNGELTWHDALPYGQLHLAGENLRVVNLPEARVQASPDVDMKFAGRRIDVTGTVALPYARLERPDQLTNAVRVSSDEVIVSATQAPPTETFRVFSDVTLRLGERVTIDTLGLAGRLSGSLRTVTDDTGFNRGTGELQVEEGKYTAYGRKLDIERGRLQFSDGPLNDPAIDLRAIKKFPDITAGVNVRGTLRNPRTTFFSDPPVSQSQIVSLLLAGGSLQSVQSTSDTTQRNSAARSAAVLQGGALLFQQFGSKVGIEDVSVESDLNNDTSLVLGRYLSPRLYIGYGISLAESINTIKMRYTIGDHWTIKTEAGRAQGADLVYTIER